MRSLMLALLLACAVSVQAQNSPPSSEKSSASQAGDSQAPSSASAPAKPSSQPMPGPNQEPPRSDRVDASALADEQGESSSKDTQIDLSPPAGDDKAHPQSSDILMDAEESSGGGDVGEFHPFEPHKAAKDIEVGDFYFKIKKNYRAAESRYREALFYKENDADATFKLAVCLEKEDRREEAREEYENYLKILPYGPQAAEAKKAISRLKSPPAANAAVQNPTK